MSNDNIDKPNNKSDQRGKNGGKREGAGRPKGALSKTTIEQKIVEEEFRQRVLKSMNKLINSQMTLARGVNMLFKINTKKDKKGNEVSSKPELVADQDEIENYLAGAYEDQDDDYYFITTSKPDNKALDSLIDRVFGKANSTMDINHSGRVEQVHSEDVKNKKEVLDLAKKYEEDLKKELMK